MKLDSREKRQALSLYCASRDKCDDRCCALFPYCDEKPISIVPDVTIDALYEKYINLPEVSIKLNQDAKADAGKLPMNLVPTQINRDIAQVRQYGNEKYKDPNNWRKVEKIRYVAALERHLLAYKDYLNGDDDGLDKESGIEHYKHMACNMAFICEMERWEKKE